MEKNKVNVCVKQKIFREINLHNVCKCCSENVVSTKKEYVLRECCVSYQKIRLSTYFIMKTILIFSYSRKMANNFSQRRKISFSMMCDLIRFCSDICTLMGLDTSDRGQLCCCWLILLLSYNF